MSSPNPAKAELRAHARAARQALSPHEREAAARQLGARLLALPELAGVDAVLAYAALGEEIDPGPAVRRLRAHNVRIALPRVAAPRTLALHWAAEDQHFIPGPFGIAEPAADAAEAFPADLDAVIVPGVAFDAACGRIGYGGGYYDELLAILPDRVRTIGVAYDQQIVDAVPQDAHDALVDLVVTPTAVYRRR